MIRHRVLYNKTGGNWRRGGLVVERRIPAWEARWPSGRASDSGITQNTAIFHGC